VDDLVSFPWHPRRGLASKGYARRELAHDRSSLGAPETLGEACLLECGDETGERVVR